MIGRKYVEEKTDFHLKKRLPSQHVSIKLKFGPIRRLHLFDIIMMTFLSEHYLSQWYAGTEGTKENKN